MGAIATAAPPRHAQVLVRPVLGLAGVLAVVGVGYRAMSRQQPTVMRGAGMSAGTPLRAACEN
jgi:hypothetical protein